MLYLTFASTPVERRELQSWMDGVDSPNAERTEATRADELKRVAAALARSHTEALVVPVGVSWRAGRERETAPFSSFVAVGWLRHFGRPLGRLQRAVLDHDPNRVRVVVGDSVPVRELRKRWLSSGLIAAGNESFARFVVQQGVLALERAERDLLGDRYQVPTLAREEISRSRSFWSGVRALSEASGRSPGLLAEAALHRLDEMMARQTRLGVDVFARLERWLLRSYRLEFDPSELDRVRELNRRHSLVFLPSHRSYLDPMVLGLILREHGFPPNHVLGGINLDFWPVGPLARRAGVVFIRRSFRDDEVYKFALRQYLGYLVRNGFNLEWYLEGGRSRTGKLRPPRFGLFAYLVTAFRQAEVEDVTLVPVGIVYDQLHEVGEMAREAHGAAKRRESLAMLVRYARAQGRRFGAIHLRIGEPLSLRESLAAAGDPRLEVEKVALEVCHRINEVTPITPTSLVALILLGVGSRAMRLPEIRAALDPLLDYVAARQLPLTGPGLLRREDGVLRTLEELAMHGVVRRFSDGPEPVYAIGPDQHLVAAYYRNAAIHFFVNRAIGELAVAGLTRAHASDPLAAAWAEAQNLRDLLKFEFFFPRRSAFAEQLRQELELVDPVGRGLDLPDALQRSRLHLAYRVLGSFLEAYFVVADRLAARDPDLHFDEGPFVVDCLAAGRQYLRQQRIHSPEAVSNELFGSGVKLAANRGLTERKGPSSPPDQLQERRQAFVAELSGLLERIEMGRQLALRSPGRQR